MKYSLSSLVVLVFVTQAQAVGKITWTTGYPTPTTGSKTQIDIKGTVTPDPGWSIPTGAMCTATVWIGGTDYILPYPNVPLTNGTFFSTLGALSPGTTYSVYVETELQNNSTKAKKTIRTAAASVTTNK